MITNHSYLDNPTFRGMRQSLMQTFDEIYVLDLHGNSLKKETCLDGSTDKNVFDIRQGVSIAFFVKRGGKGRRLPLCDTPSCGDYASENMIGFQRTTLASTQWQEFVTPQPEFFLFLPRSSPSVLRFMGSASALPQVFMLSSTRHTRPIEIISYSILTVKH